MTTTEDVAPELKTPVGPEQTIITGARSSDAGAANTAPPERNLIGAKPTEAQLRKAFQNADARHQRADGLERVIAKGDSHRNSDPHWPTEVIGSDADSPVTGDAADAKPTAAQVKASAEKHPVGQRADSAQRIVARGDSHREPKADKGTDANPKRTPAKTPVGQKANAGKPKAAAKRAAPKRK